MDYLTYILIVAGGLGLCYVWLRRSAPAMETEQQTRAPLLEQTRPAKDAINNDKRPETLVSAETALNRQSLQTPIPWGWPGHHEHETAAANSSNHGNEAHVVSDSLHRFVDRLLAEKQTVESRDYVLRKDASIRALLEDRYGKVRTAPGTRRQGAESAVIRGFDEPLEFERIKEVKTPWGW